MNKYFTVIIIILLCFLASCSSHKNNYNSEECKYFQIEANIYDDTLFVTLQFDLGIATRDTLDISTVPFDTLDPSTVPIVANIIPVVPLGSFIITVNLKDEKLKTIKIGDDSDSKSSTYNWEKVSKRVQNELIRYRGKRKTCLD